MYFVSLCFSELIGRESSFIGRRLAMGLPKEMINESPYRGRNYVRETSDTSVITD
jgi:hypothetical protein